MYEASTRFATVLAVAGARLVLWVTAATGSGGNSGVRQQAFQATGSNSATTDRSFQRLTGMTLAVANRRSVVGSIFSGTFTGQRWRSG